MKILAILLIFTIGHAMACQDNETDQGHPFIKVTTVADNQTFTRDTIKPRSNRIIYDQARAQSDIDTLYPFDITLQTIEGNLISSSEVLRADGKPTVVLFWLTTCYPCRIEMKAIQAEVDRWRAETDFNIVAISTDFEKNYARVVEMVEKSNWSFDSYWDMNREFRKVLPGQLNGLPQSFIFDKDGKLVYHKRKYNTGDEHRLYEKVKEIAAAK